MVPTRFKAFRIFDDETGHRSEVVEQGVDEQTAGDVVIQVAWSSVNYKDALAGTGKGKILRQFPLNGGIDVAGVVAQSESADFREGDEVLMTGCGLSETRDGGYSEYLRVPSEWLIPLPQGLDLREAMALGTAGFTAALGLYRMEANGQTPDMGPLCVTGASGGVGSLAVDIYSKAGYEVCALSGKSEEFGWLHELGAEQCVDRHGLEWPSAPMASARFAGALDNVGGEGLSGLTRMIKPWGSIASCGMAGGIDLNTTVMPFIIRGISLIGINSAGCRYSIRSEVWQRLAGDWKPRHLDKIVTAVSELDGLPDCFERLLSGGGHGRTLVRIGADAAA